MIQKILCVDDDEIARLVTSEMIKTLWPDVEIDFAENGRIALDFLNNNDSNNSSPDVILLDLNMPILNGWEFLEIFESRYQSRYPNVYITILSSSVHYRDTLKAKKYPSVKRYASKPLTHDILSEILKDMYT